MKEISIKAPAKINLSLDIVGLRKDHYHLMEMVMQTINLYDILHIKLSDQKEIQLISEKIGIPLDHTNIAYKVADAFFRYANIKEYGVQISIEKNIPFGAGLGGGSADGAGVLVALNELYETNYSMEELIIIGQTVGADIPFCLIGGTALVEGIGEKITKIDDMPMCHIVLAKPVEGINTKLAFMTYDNMTEINHPDIKMILNAMKEQDINKISEHMVNVFEQTIQLNSIEKIKTTMMKNGALNAMMTGSGSAVFGIFTEYTKAEHCLKKLKRLNFESFLCQPIIRGPIKI